MEQEVTALLVKTAVGCGRSGRNVIRPNGEGVLSARCEWTVPISRRDPPRVA